MVLPAMYAMLTNTRTRILFFIVFRRISKVSPIPSVKSAVIDNITASDHSHITYDMTSLQKAVNENFDVRATQRENETLIFSDDLPTHHDSPEVDVGPIVDASSMKGCSNLQKKSKRLKSSQQRIRRLTKKINILKNGYAERNKWSTATLIKNAANYLNKTSLEFFKIQLHLASRAKTGRRYNDIQKSFALGLYFQSARAYRFLSKFFKLPSPRMLRYYLSKIDLEVGWAESNFNIVKERNNQMSETEKICGITFDAISLKSGIYYDIVKDQIIGYENMGEYGHSDKIAQYALVFMAKGLCVKWKQVLGYFLFHTSISADILRQMIIDCIAKLLSCGLHPKFVVCDQDSSHRSCFDKLGITNDKPYTEVNGEKVFFL
ncbi:uncharacterized protein LOC143034907 isoform X2 [Oratosquilla oratoria]|uniref:uncharacterized protein LOC143034907 isoform X2 n=1 Tax=Oratosquilla oratoria TaxID=337810 RepID=UPI003F75B87B